MLYIIGSPIGNIQDLSYRAAHTLVTSDIILAEDTRSAQNLLHAIYDLFFPTKEKIIPKIISYYKEKELHKLPSILEDLRDNKNISLISESGMPIISDPGSLLVYAVVREDISFTVIPGPSAVTTALIHSGTPMNEFMFIGFLPKKQGKLVKQLESIKTFKSVMPKLSIIAFESPHRINATLLAIKENLPEAHISVARELTKKYEEVIRSKGKDIDVEREYKGEITIVIS
ncbi:MAG: 16S rRNA (cytidine(1402)-2'-O)-methyltransferase [bacterium]|nr:16S rRNA (cytidine(1402)-2'-O)-methyltransferase [bacterium]